MNIFEYEGKDFDKKLDEIFDDVDKEKLKQELIECGLEINSLNRLKYLMKKIDKIVENISIEEIEERIKEDEMEEDIKILEDFINGEIERDKLENYKGGYKLGFFYTKDLQQAIKHLIKEYKELKKYKRKHSLVKNNYIPKSKVKEKIEELNKKKRKSQIEYSIIDELIFDKKIEILQELLEEIE